MRMEPRKHILLDLNVILIANLDLLSKLSESNVFHDFISYTTGRPHYVQHFSEAKHILHTCQKMKAQVIRTTLTKLLLVSHL